MSEGVQIPGVKATFFSTQYAATLGLNRIFVLTYKVGFFEKLGFRQVDKATLPHKIWADCIKCIKFPECDEVAMILEH